MATFRKLKHPPIKEIILTISFNENLETGDLERYQRLPQIVRNFKVVDKGYKTKIEKKRNETPNTNTNLDGYVLRSEKSNNRVIQTRLGSFALHAVNEYTPFEDLLAETIQYWKLLGISVNKTLTVNRVSARYLNFLENESQLPHEKIVNVFVKHPYSDTVENTFTSLKLKCGSDNKINATIIVTESKGKQLGIIVDILTDRTIEYDSDSKKLEAYFYELRRVKNKLFFETITETAAKKYDS
jgi:uncharacterized protein (TIGR04255 family)